MFYDAPQCCPIVYLTPRRLDLRLVILSPSTKLIASMRLDLPARKQNKKSTKQQNQNHPTQTVHSRLITQTIVHYELITLTTNHNNKQSNNPMTTSDTKIS